ncbi:hypothetical protein BpHYR1_013974 [Brachionus plicatilis]|uniref:Uncharacterized protein n=1 Tax=Brachionus plicatilis TaxID=10195 RepID=A0A3M7SSN6_BRAPC|nr:hypothetical protein BpHYR1_013974 [Brachionus plicatilis]
MCLNIYIHQWMSRDDNPNKSNILRSKKIKSGFINRENRGCTPLENSFQEYYDLSNLMHKNLQIVQNAVIDLVVLQLKN